MVDKNGEMSIDQARLLLGVTPLARESEINSRYAIYRTEVLQDADTFNSPEAKLALERLQQARNILLNAILDNPIPEPPTANTLTSEPVKNPGKGVGARASGRWNYVMIAFVCLAIGAALAWYIRDQQAKIELKGMVSADELQAAVLAARPTIMSEAASGTQAAVKAAEVSMKRKADWCTELAGFWHSWSYYDTGKGYRGRMILHTKDCDGENKAILEGILIEASSQEQLTTDKSVTDIMYARVERTGKTAKLRITKATNAFDGTSPNYDGASRDMIIGELVSGTRKRGTCLYVEEEGKVKTNFCRIL